MRAVYHAVQSHLPLLARGVVLLAVGDHVPDHILLLVYRVVDFGAGWLQVCCRSALCLSLSLSDYPVRCQATLCASPDTCTSCS